MAGVSNIEKTHHWHIENGDMFIHNNIHLAIAAGAILYHHLLVGSKFFHMTMFNLTAELNPGLIEIVRNPTGIVLGSPAAFNNKNTGFYEGGSFTLGTGVHYDGDALYGTKQSGGGGGTETEIIFSPGDNVFFAYTNNAVNPSDVNFHLEGYED